MRQPVVMPKKRLFWLLASVLIKGGSGIVPGYWLCSYFYPALA